MPEARHRVMFGDADSAGRGADMSLPPAAGDPWSDATSRWESFLMAIAEECRMGPLVAHGTTISGLAYRAEYEVDELGRAYLQGWCKVRHATGLLAAYGKYDKGVRHGRWYFWDGHGEIVEEVIYNEGAREEYVVYRRSRGLLAIW